MESAITDLEKRINDIKKRLPAHSVRPAMIEELESLEEQLSILKQNLAGEKKDAT
ncbi:MAG: histidine kinase [Bacillota bacterium]